ncbi:hypothetical protein [Paraburkholderia caribensis]|uniref:hypothetical protein n=1 Tax=Paraburkholderia caribensis TaxID=75105 RepID=UPI001CB2BE6A|nr:conserved hypothetical protein [Paraburkholderia caribensis]
MEDKFLALTTDQSLLSELRSAAEHKPSQAELAAQRVSFVYGFMKPSSGVTREQVRKVLGAGA